MNLQQKLRVGATRCEGNRSAEASDLAKQCTSVISTFAMLAVLSNPSVGKATAQGEKFRKDLHMMLETIQEDSLNVPENILSRARSVGPMAKISRQSASGSSVDAAGPAAEAAEAVAPPLPTRWRILL